MVRKIYYWSRRPELLAGLIYIVQEVMEIAANTTVALKCALSNPIQSVLFIQNFYIDARLDFLALKVVKISGNTVT